MKPALVLARQAGLMRMAIQSGNVITQLTGLQIPATLTEQTVVTLPGIVVA